MKRSIRTTLAFVKDVIALPLWEPKLVNKMKNNKHKPNSSSPRTFSKSIPYTCFITLLGCFCVLMGSLQCGTDSEFIYITPAAMQAAQASFTPAPDEVVTTLTPTITWTSITGATHYTLEVNDEALITTTNTSFTFTDELSCLHYPFKWRILAKNDFQVQPSDIRLFYVDPSLYDFPPGYTAACGSTPMDTSVPERWVENIEFYYFDDAGAKIPVKDGASIQVSKLRVKAQFKEPGDCLPPVVAGYNYDNLRYFGAVTLNVNDVEFELRPYWDGENYIWTFEDFEFSLNYGDGGVNKVGIFIYSFENLAFTPIGRSSIFSFTGTFTTPDIQVQLYWNSLSDLDLYLYPPSGASKPLCYYNEQIVDLQYGGQVQLDIDKREGIGYGPENLLIYHPDPGTYRVEIRYYTTYLENNNPLTAMLYIFKNGILQTGENGTDALSSCADYTFPCNPNPALPPEEKHREPCSVTEIEIE